MKKYEVLYNWPIEQLNRLTSSDIANDFAENLTEPQNSAFAKLSELMRGVMGDMVTARNRREHFRKWPELQSHLDDFRRQYTHFPDASLNKFRLSVSFAQKLAQDGVTLDEDDINETFFEIHELPAPLPIHWFSRVAKTFDQSVAVFSCLDCPRLTEDLSNAKVSTDLLFHLLAVLNAVTDVSQQHAVLTKRSTTRPELADIEAFAKLSILASGKPIHSQPPYTASPRVIDIECIKFGTPYNQWNDVLHVLSEYNSRDEILLKFLTIYHVIENFMFKLPIVALERQRNGQMFSIRDFQMLYGKIKSNESESIHRLFTTIFKLSAEPAKSFAKRIEDRWESLFKSTAHDIDKKLLDLGFTFTFSTFTKNSAQSFASLVYLIRNAIVHNKETEFHLTYASLDSTLRTMIESFLIPSLEEICFSQIGSHNSNLWYHSKHLLLYK